VKQDATPAQPHAGDFAGHAPVEQCAAADWQFRQQLFFVNEANLGCRLRAAGIKNKLMFHKLPFFAGKYESIHCRSVTLPLYCWRPVTGQYAIVLRDGIVQRRQLAHSHQNLNVMLREPG
jgi:hypothetical protein